MTNLRHTGHRPTAQFLQFLLKWAQMSVQHTFTGEMSLKTGYIQGAYWTNKTVNIKINKHAKL